MTKIPDQEKDEHGDRNAEKRIDAGELKEEESDEGADNDHGAVGDIDDVHDTPGE